MKAEGYTAVSAKRRRSPAEVADWCARFESGFRKKGIRVTPQRLAVYRAVVEDTTHPSAEEIHARLRSRMSSLSTATVYRTLEFLEKQGLVCRVSTTESICRFDANVGSHRHLVCRVCGAIRDWDEPVPGGTGAEFVDVPGFRVEEVDVRLVGVCEICQRGGDSSRQNVG